MEAKKGRGQEAAGPVEPGRGMDRMNLLEKLESEGWFNKFDGFKRDPIPLADLDKRLALLAKYGVRSYRDGLLSLDLDPSRARTKKQDGEQPFIPPP